MWHLGACGRVGAGFDVADYFVGFDVVINMAGIFAAFVLSGFLAAAITITHDRIVTCGFRCTWRQHKLEKLEFYALWLVVNNQTP